MANDNNNDPRRTKLRYVVELENGEKVTGDAEAWLFAIINSLPQEQFDLVIRYVKASPSPQMIVPNPGGVVFHLGGR